MQENMAQISLSQFMLMALDFLQLKVPQYLYGQKNPQAQSLEIYRIKKEKKFRQK